MKKKTLFFLVALFNLAANYAHPVTPTYFKMLHLDNSVFGTAFAVMSFGIFITSPFWSKIAGLVNSKSVIAIGCIGYAVAQFLFAVGHTTSLILIGRLLAGLACGAFFVGVLNYIVNLSSEINRGANLTLNATIQTVASALGYFAGGMLGAYNVYLSFAVQVIQLTLVGILFYLLLEKDSQNTDSLQLSLILKESNPLKRLEDGRLLMNKAFALLFSVSILLYLGYTAFDQSFNYYLKDIFNLSSSFNGIFKGAIGIISLIVNTSIGLYLMKNTKISKSLIYVLLGASTLMVLILFSHHLTAYVISSCIFYGFYALSTPLLQDLITQEAQVKTRNLVLGFYQSTQSLGQILGAYLAGIIYNFSPQAPFSLAFLALLGAFLCSIFYRRMYRI